MFKRLKEKISGWAKKISKEAGEEEIKIKGLPAEDKKKPSKEISREIEAPMRFQAGELKYEPDLEKLDEKARKAEKNDKELLLEEKEPTAPGEKGFFKRITSKISRVKISEQDFRAYTDEFEMLLLENNVALDVAEKIIFNLKDRVVEKELLKKEIESEIREGLREIIEEILLDPFDLVEKITSKHKSQEKSPEKNPYIILFCGINGTGKTTTVAKVASYLHGKGISCVMAAGDTFRAASIEQIKKHGDVLGIKVISQSYGSDPASVGFDAIKYAKKNHIKCVLIDTAGRMHTAKNLLREMEKIVKVTNPDTKIFVGESITGNDALEQVRSFDWAIGIDGIILTKADIDEKGGTALSVGYVTKKPILYLGTGQEYDKIEPFDKKKFIEKLGL